MRKEPVYIVYGNHGVAPVQLEDYHLYFQQAFPTLGYQPIFTQFPVAGKLNVLIEAFDPQFEELISSAAAVKGTRFITIVTEFVTGNTFNRFRKHEVTRTQSVFWIDFKDWLKDMIPVLFPRFVRRLFIKYAPEFYSWAKPYYHYLTSAGSGSGAPIHLQEKYWRGRFDNFVKVAKHSESIWCVSPHQLEEYRALVGASKVALMPMVSWSSNCQNVFQGAFHKDIDFLFTGSITPHRQKVFSKLKERGYKVVVGPPTWPGYLRDHFIARSKVCLQVLQDSDWKYPSIMRYHYLLCSGAVIVSEKATQTCYQEDYLVNVDAQNLIETCERVIAEGDFLARGATASQKYYEAGAPYRTQFRDLLSAGEGSRFNAHETTL